MKLLNTITIILLIFCCSCGDENPATDFSQDGVSFKVPSGWSVSEEGEFFDTGYYVSVEKLGFDASGLFTLTWYDFELDLEDEILSMQENFKGQGMFSNIKFEPIREVKYNDMKALACSYQFSLIGLEHEGEIYTFYDGERTFSIVKQVAIEDASSDKNGFEIIESTFEVK